MPTIEMLLTIFLRAISNHPKEGLQTLIPQLFARHNMTCGRILMPFQTHLNFLVQRGWNIKIFLDHHLEMFVGQCTAPFRRAHSSSISLLKFTIKLTSISTPPISIVTKASMYLRYPHVHSYASQCARLRILGAMSTTPTTNTMHTLNF